MALHSIELCAGVGMLGEGVRAAFELLGTDHRTICYVEREAAAAAQLGTLMEAGALHAAPVWSDMLTFDGSAWRGLVDGVVAGFPCQDLSIAGRRAGLDGKRSGLFFRVLDIADDCGAWFLVLENVAGIATATATVVDEAEGEIEERAAARVLGELADRGWDAEWVTLSASDVGASHGRARWFCFAWRRELVNAERSRWTQARGGPVLNTGCQPEPGGCDLGNAGLQHQQLQQREVRAESAPAGDGLAYTPCDRRNQGRAEPGGQQGRSDAPECSGAMANASLAGRQRGELSGARHDQWHGTHAHGSTPQLRGAPLFAPGPADPVWRDLLGASRLGAWSRAVTDDEAGACPWAPATKPGVRMLVDGMAIVVDESRAHQLRQVGNGVVPLQAAAAVVELVRRASVALRNL